MVNWILHLDNVLNGYVSMAILMYMYDWIMKSVCLS